MNVYDFDKTIFKIDSTAGLVKYLFVHEPRSLLSIPRTVVFGIGYGLHIVKKLTFKTNLYHMFTFVKDMDAVVDAYVEDSMQYVQKWYLEQQKADDVIISASPEFLIKRFAKKLGVQYVMASKVDLYSGLKLSWKRKGDKILCHVSGRTCGWILVRFSYRYSFSAHCRSCLSGKRC